MVHPLGGAKISILAAWQKQTVCSPGKKRSYSV